MNEEVSPAAYMKSQMQENFPTPDVEDGNSGIKGNDQEDGMAIYNNTAADPVTRGVEDAPTNKRGNETSTGDNNVDE